MTRTHGAAADRGIAIRLRDASIGYGDVPIVAQVDLTVRHGEAVAVLGSNGSGKTTLARGLLGLAAVGLSDRVNDPVASLSGGQQRRVLVARALAAEPELLIMDEPTAGVDAASQDALAAVLTDVSATGTTLAVVTHETGPLAGVLRRAIVVDHGRISYDGPLAGAGPDTGGHHHSGDPVEPEGRGYRIDQLRVTTAAARGHLGGR